MTAETILKWTRRQPFVPFGLRLTDGTVYEIHHPAMIIPTFDTVIVAIPAKPESRRQAAQEANWVSLLHIMELFPLHEAASSKKRRA
jgi:hypothetical protein